MNVLSSLSGINLTLCRNFFHSRSNFHCLHTLGSFSYVTQGSFVFLLIFSTAFIPSQLTPKGHNCPHQRSAFEKALIQWQHPPFKIDFVCLQTSAEHFLAASERQLSRELVHIPAVNRPWRHVRVCLLVAVFSTLSCPVKHDPGCWWGCLCAFFFCNPLHFHTGPPSPGPGAITPYMLTIWPSEPLMHFGWKTRKKNVSNTWAAVLITTVFLLTADKFKIKEDILVKTH